MATFCFKEKRRFREFSNTVLRLTHVQDDQSCNTVSTISCSTSALRACIVIHSFAAVSGMEPAFRVVANDSDP